MDYPPENDQVNFGSASAIATASTKRTKATMRYLRSDVAARRQLEILDRASLAPNITHQERIEIADRITALLGRLEKIRSKRAKPKRQRREVSEGIL